MRSRNSGRRCIILASLRTRSAEISRSDGAASSPVAYLLCCFAAAAAVGCYSCMMHLLTLSALRLIAVVFGDVRRAQRWSWGS